MPFVSPSTNLSRQICEISSGRREPYLQRESTHLLILIQLKWNPEMHEAGSKP